MMMKLSSEPLNNRSFKFRTYHMLINEGIFGNKQKHRQTAEKIQRQQSA